MILVDSTHQTCCRRLSSQAGIEGHPSREVTTQDEEGEQEHESFRDLDIVLDEGAGETC